MRPPLVRTLAIIAALGLLPGPAIAAEPADSAAVALPALVRYDDAAGDAGAVPGPDILSVTLTRTGPATVDVAVTFAGDPPLAWDEDAGWMETLMVLIGTDPLGIHRDPVLGPDAEYVTGVHAIDPLIGHAPMLAHMDAGPGEERFIEGAVTAATAGSTVTLRLDATTLGDPGTIFLFLVTGREASEGGGTDSDVLPDQATGSTTVIAIPWTFREVARGR